MPGKRPIFILGGSGDILITVDTLPSRWCQEQTLVPSFLWPFPQIRQCFVLFLYTWSTLPVVYSLSFTHSHYRSPCALPIFSIYWYSFLPSYTFPPHFFISFPQGPAGSRVIKRWCLGHKKVSRVRSSLSVSQGHTRYPRPDPAIPYLIFQFILT